MRIFSLTNCILTFLLGWIFGSIFIFFLLSSQEQFISHKHVVLLNPNYNGDSKDHTKSFLRYQTHQHTLMPEHLPDVEAATVQKHDPIHEGAQKDDGADKEEKPFIIYLYWPYPEDQFSIHQYKALESILSNFPNALIRITLLPTIQQFQLLTDLSSLTSFHDLKNTKNSAFLHPKLFDKYRKMSYRIEVTFITLDELTTTGHNHNLFQRESWNQDNTISLGKSYLKNHVTPCCEDCEILCFVPSTTQNFNKQPDSQNFHTEEKSPPHTSPTVPYHLITYLHTLLLFKTGGIFSDFSFYFINPLESPWIHQGYFIHAYCTHVKPTATLSKHRRHHSHKKISSTSMYSHDIQIYYPKLYDNWKELQCYSSSLYYFPTKRNIILQCLLEKYHDDKVFLICIDSDTFFHGANCIREALDQCLHRINEERMNKLNAKSLVSLYSTFLNSKLRTEQQPSFLINSFSNELPQDINNHPIKHESSTLSPQDLVLHDRVTGLLETFQDNPMIANHTILSVHNWTVNSNTRILWLGHLAWQQIHLSSANGHLSSQAHHHQHHFYPYPKGSLLSIAETRNRQYKLYRFVPSQSSQSHEGKRANQRFYSCRYFHDHVIIPQYLLQLIEKQHSYWHQQFTNAQSNPTSNLANIFEAVSPHPSQISQNVSSNEKPFSTKLPINVSKLILNRSDSEVMNEAGTLSLNISSSQTNHTFHMTPTETNFSLSSYSTLPVLPLVNSSLEANATYTSSTQSVISTGYNLTVRHLNDTHSDLWNSSQAIEPHKYHLRGYHDKRMKRRRLNELTAPLKDKILLRDYFHKKSVLRTNHTNYEISLIDVLYPSLKGSFHSRLVEVSFGKDENTEVEISNQKDEIHFENDLSCNPSIFIVGFLHSSSQILLNYFHQHPRLLMGFSSVHSFPKGELLKSEVHVDGCYNVISPKYYTNSEWFQLSSSQETTAEFSKSFSRADCYPYIDHNESFIAVDASMQYNTNPFTPFLIKQDHPQAKILFLVENPVHRLMKHSKRFCHQLKQTEFYGFENLDRYLMSFIDHSSSILSKFRILVSQYLYWQDHKSESEESKKPEGNDDDNKDNQLDLYQIIEFYYFDILLKHYRHPSVDLSKIEMEKKDFSRGIREELQKRKKEQDQIGLELFLHSFYLPVMYYYMNIFPIENIIVLNTERFMNPRRAGNNTYQSVDTHIKYVSKELHIEYDEIGPNSSQGNDTRVEFLVPPHSYEKVLKNLYSSKLKLEQHSETEKERVESDLDDDQIYSNSPECELSIDVYDKLVHFFTPFNLILEQYLNFSIAHWNEEYDVDEVNYRPINLNTLYTLGMNDTRPMLWYELKDEEYNHKLTSSPKKKVKIASNQLVDKLVPQRNSEEDSGFNTTLGMLNTF